MGWEQRGNNFYYYRKEREGSSVRSIYVGGSETATLISQLEELQREEAQERREGQRRELAKHEQQDATIEAASRLIDTIKDATLIAGGFHQHKRQWRKRRT
ncbi:MAG TPA: hypothetical protein VMM84_01565 [Pyrinomonadaceae bacterium]|nr:hypothetical protein [Pyrinomonadaceae bacterium]